MVSQAGLHRFKLCLMVSTIASGVITTSRPARAQTSTALEPITVPARVLEAPGARPRTTLVLTAAAGPTPVYMLQSDDRWMARCLTPCVLVVPIGGITIATVPTGANSVTLTVPDDGLSVEVPVPRPLTFRTFVPASIVAQRPTVVDWGGPIRTDNTGLSTLAVTGIAIAVSGTTLSAIFYGVWLSSLPSILRGSGSGPWLVASGVAILGVPAGALIAWAGWGPTSPARQSTSRLRFAPAIVPTFTSATQGIALFGQF